MALADGAGTAPAAAGLLVAALAAAGLTGVAGGVSAVSRPVTASAAASTPHSSLVARAGHD